MIHLYGIPNCDTVKKSLDFLKKNGIECTFHDFKKEGVKATQLKAWSKAVGRDILLNKKSATWRGLPPEEQALASSEKGAIALMQEKTSVIKRPVAEWPDGTITVGFDEKSFSIKV
jgi:Spx/MgsR family transcriptional regulator